MPLPNSLIALPNNLIPPMIASLARFAFKIVPNEIAFSPASFIEPPNISVSSDAFFVESVALLISASLSLIRLLNLFISDCVLAISSFHFRVRLSASPKFSDAFFKPFSCSTKRLFNWSMFFSSSLFSLLASPMVLLLRVNSVDT